MATKRQYTEENKAIALAAYAAHGNNAERTAKFLGIPRGTLLRWINGVNEDVVAKATQKKQDMADECERIAWTLLASLEDETAIAVAPLHSRSTAFGTIVDKMRLLRGQSTQALDVNDQRTALHEKWASLTAEDAAGEVPALPDGSSGGNS